MVCISNFQREEKGASDETRPQPACNPPDAYGLPFSPRHSRESENPRVGEQARRAKPCAERSQRIPISHSTPRHSRESGNPHIGKQARRVETER